MWRMWRDGPGILGPAGRLCAIAGPTPAGGGRGVHARWQLPPSERGATMGKMMKARLPAAGMALAASPPLAAGAAAEGSGVSSDEAVAGRRSMRPSPDLQVDGVGDPRIQFELNGLTSFVNFYDCKADRCGSLQLETALDLEHGTTLQAANVFNSRYRYVRLHLDDEMEIGRASCRER